MDDAVNGFFFLAPRMRSRCLDNSKESGRIPCWVIANSDGAERGTTTPPQRGHYIGVLPAAGWKWGAARERGHWRRASQARWFTLAERVLNCAPM